MREAGIALLTVGLLSAVIAVIVMDGGQLGYLRGCAAAFAGVGMMLTGAVLLAGTAIATAISTQGRNRVPELLDQP